MATDNATGLGGRFATVHTVIEPSYIAHSRKSCMAASLFRSLTMVVKDSNF